MLPFLLLTSELLLLVMLLPADLALNQLVVRRNLTHNAREGVGHLVERV